MAGEYVEGFMAAGFMTEQKRAALDRLLFDRDVPSPRRRCAVAVVIPDYDFNGQTGMRGSPVGQQCHSAVALSGVVVKKISEHNQTPSAGLYQQSCEPGQVCWRGSMGDRNPRLAERGCFSEMGIADHERGFGWPVNSAIGKQVH